MGQMWKVLQMMIFLRLDQGLFQGVTLSTQDHHWSLSPWNILIMDLTTWLLDTRDVVLFVNAALIKSKFALVLGEAFNFAISIDSCWFIPKRHSLVILTCFFCLFKNSWMRIIGCSQKLLPNLLPSFNVTRTLEWFDSLAAFPCSPLLPGILDRQY